MQRSSRCARPRPASAGAEKLCAPHQFHRLRRLPAPTAKRLSNISARTSPSFVLPAANGWRRILFASSTAKVRSARPSPPARRKRSNICAGTAATTLRVCRNCWIAAASRSQSTPASCAVWIIIPARCSNSSRRGSARRAPSAAAARYGGLLSELGGTDMSGVGFGMGADPSAVGDAGRRRAPRARRRPGRSSCAHRGR